MHNCVFCQIVAGKSPCFKVYDDKNFLGFLDTNPRSAGHSLLIPKTHYRWVYDVPEFNRYWLVVLKITRAMQKALSPIWISYFTHGLVPHAHIHILPRYQPVLGASILPMETVGLTEKEMTEIARKIFENL